MVKIAGPASMIDRLMAEVCNDGRVSVPMDDLAEALGVAEADLVGPVREAIDRGWLSSWCPRGDGEAAVTLAPVLAAGLGREVGTVGKWRPVGSRPKRHEFTARSGRRERTFTDVFGVHSLVAMDRVQAPEVRVSDTAPSVLLGLRLSWPIAPMPDGRCGGCGDRGGPHTFCCWCGKPCGSLTAKANARGEAERLRNARERKAVKVAGKPARPARAKACK